MIRSLKDTTPNAKRGLFFLETLHRKRMGDWLVLTIHSTRRNVLLMSAIWIHLGTLTFKPAPNVCILSKMLECRRVEPLRTGCWWRDAETSKIDLEMTYAPYWVNIADLFIVDCKPFRRLICCFHTTRSQSSRLQTAYE